MRALYPVFVLSLIACGAPPPPTSEQADPTWASSELNARTRRGVLAAAAQDIPCDEGRLTLAGDASYRSINDETVRALFVVEGCGERLTYVTICGPNESPCRAVAIARLALPK